MQNERLCIFVSDVSSLPENLHCGEKAAGIEDITAKAKKKPGLEGLVA